MKLHFTKFGNSKKNLIILHGLLGSSDNWKTLAVQWSEYFTVYTLDLRNHGLSDHSESMNYDVMSDDIIEFITINELNNVSLLGHSMGGKVAMSVALKHPSLIDKLIVVDIAPIRYDGGHEYIFKAMKDLPIAKIERRKEADEWMKSRLRNKAVRQFVLKNLKRDNNGSYTWKANLNTIITNYQLLIGFPDFGTHFLKPTLFIKGGISDYIDPFHLEEYKLLFPNMAIEEIPNVGHWLHAEAPDVFYDLVLEFIRSL